MAVNVAPPPAELVYIRRSNKLFTKVKDQFDKGWKHNDKTSEMKALYLLNEDKTEWLKAKCSHLPPISDEDEKARIILFHGTRRACRIGQDTKTPCTNPECNLCCILRESFKIEVANASGLLGKGIYCTPVSSKADHYSRNHHIHSKQHAILLCRVVCNRAQPLRNSQHNRRAPDSGYNAVEGLTQDKGGSLLYPEIAVYREDAIVPVGIVMYSREGWKP